jgi:hypothetical protein
VPATPRQLACPALAIILAAAYGWWAVSLPPFSARATVAILVAGGTAIAMGTLHRRKPREAPSRAGAGWWALAATVAVGWQVAAYVQQPRAEHPTVSSLANALLSTQPARTVAFVVWVVIAVELARR